MTMRIENIQPTPTVTKLEKVETEKSETEKKAEVKETPAAVYEKTETKNTSHVYDKNAIARIKKDSQQAYSHLIRLVEEMLKRQGKTLNLLGDDEIVEVDETARLEAQALIGPDGPLGAEAVSQRLVDFAIAISGGDKSKADTLRSAIEQGFKEAEKILGELPEISKETYKLTMEKFDAWVNEE
jgi:CHAT domain-containing protein